MAGNGPPDAVLTSGALSVGATSFAGSSIVGNGASTLGSTTGGTSVTTVAAGGGETTGASSSVCVGNVGKVSSGAAEPSIGAPTALAAGTLVLGGRAGMAGSDAGGSDGKPAGAETSDFWIVPGGKGAGGGRLEEFDTAPAASTVPASDTPEAGVDWLQANPLQVNTVHPSRAAINVRRREINLSPLVNVANNAIE